MRLSPHSDESLASDPILARHRARIVEILTRAETVISVPLGITISGHKSFHDRGGSISLRLPRRAYIGLERSSTPGLTLGTLLEYDVAHDVFVPAPAVFREHTGNLLSAFATDGFSGTIHILIEGQDGNGMSMIGAVGVGIPLLRDLELGVVTAKTLAAWAATPTRELLKDEGFLRLLRDGWTGQSYLRPKKHVLPAKFTGSGVLVALGSGSVNASFVVAGGSMAVVEPRDLGYTRTLGEWPIDMLILSTGARDDFGSFHEFAHDDTELTAFIESLRAQLPEETTFFQPLGSSVTEAVSFLADRAIVETFSRWWDFWKTGGKDAARAALIDSYRRREHLTLAIGSLHPAIQDAFEAIRTTAGARDHGCIPVLTGSHGGTIFIVYPSTVLRSKAPEILARMHARGYEDACWELLSWRDAAPTPGIRIEQDLAHGLPSPLLPAAALVVITHENGRVSRELLDDPSGFTDTFDLVVDAEEEQITIAGKPVSSKELPSQRMAVAALRLLLAAEPHVIINEDLPRSAYRSSRSELTAKVLAPLMKIVEARTGKKLSLRTHGRLSSYSLSLDLGDVRVAVVERLRTS